MDEPASEPAADHTEEFGEPFRGYDNVVNITKACLDGTAPQDRRYSVVGGILRTLSSCYTAITRPVRYGMCPILIMDVGYNCSAQDVDINRDFFCKLNSEAASCNMIVLLCDLYNEAYGFMEDMPEINSLDNVNVVGVDYNTLQDIFGYKRRFTTGTLFGKSDIDVIDTSIRDNEQARMSHGKFYNDSLSGCAFAEMIRANLINYVVVVGFEFIAEYMNRLFMSNTEAHMYDVDMYSRLSVDGVKKLTSLIDSRPEKLRETYEKDVLDLNNEYDEIVLRLREVSNKLIQARAALESIRSTSDKCESSYDSLKGLYEHNKIIYIHADVESQKLHIYTRNIYVMDSRTRSWHDIGKMKISIDMSGIVYNDTPGSNTVSFENMTRRVDGISANMHAPHIFADGHACHGNMLSMISKAYVDCDVYSMVYILIEFVSSVNVEDPAGKYVTCWPVVSEDVVKSDVGNKHINAVQLSNLQKSYDEVLREKIKFKNRRRK